MSDRPFDLLVIGGGINGAGIACDAAGRGLAVALAEQDDLASATSSASSKLIHGGLRYLEHYEFRLVREALNEREVLLAKAPHLVRPLRFILPHRAGMRPAWMLRLGLLLYDHLGRRVSLPGSRGVDLARDPVGAPLRAEFDKGFSYYDCRVDDARLVVLNAVQAAEKGARVLTRHRLVRAARRDGLWQADLADRRDGGARTVLARALVNATGPWVAVTLDGALARPAGRKVRLIKGSHILVPRLYEGEHAYILQHGDGRVVFVLPYEDAYSLIGTTDVPFDGDPAAAKIEAAEIDYLCATVADYFRREVKPADVVWSYAGVRPLHDDEAEDDPSALSRDYALELEAEAGQAPLLSVYGGKVTTYRRLAEEALEQLAPHLPAMGPAWTRKAALPGGEFTGGTGALAEELGRSYPGIERTYLEALARRHGTRARLVLGDAKTDADLGADFGAGLRAREIDYLCAAEWAESADDILWRRSKIGLRLDASGRRALEAYLAGDSVPRATTTS